LAPKHLVLLPGLDGTGELFVDAPIDTVEVWGSSAHGPTILNKNFTGIPKKRRGVQKDTFLRPICVLLPETSLLSTELGPATESDEASF